LKNQSFFTRFGFAINGIKSAIRSEASFRTQLSIAITVVFVLGILRANPLWWALILLCIGVVLTAEMFNTALEQLIDHIHPERHTAIGLAKDCAAGAVLISSLASVVIFMFFLIDRLNGS
jgi:undecaprenol kinase